MMTVNKIQSQETPPLYQQTCDQLIDKIETGFYQANDPLPSERLLAEELNISRMTARQALSALEKEGFAYRVGRKGRFVAEKKLSLDIGTTLSFTAKALHESIDLRIEVINQTTLPASTTLAAKLQINPEDLIHSYKRLFKIADKPVLVERESVVAEYFPDLMSKDLSQSSTMLLEKHYDVIGIQGHVTVRCAPVSQENQHLFGSHAAPYGLEVESTIHDQHGRPFCFGHQVWCNEMAEFTLLASPN